MRSGGGDAVDSEAVVEAGDAADTEAIVEEVGDAVDAEAVVEEAPDDPVDSSCVRARDAKEVVTLAGDASLESLDVAGTFG